MQIRQDIQAAWDGFVKNGSESAYFVLYRHYHHYFIYIAVQKGVSVERAKDAINDLFLYVFENRTLLSKIRSFNNYLVSSFLNNLFKKDAFSVEEPLTGKEELIADEPNLPAADGYYEPGGSPEGMTRPIQKYLDKLNPNQANMIYQSSSLA